MVKRIVLGTFIFCLFVLPPAKSFAQNDAGFIYGKIISKSGTLYQGQIRWGKEEAFWNDIFNATKSSQGDNTYEKYAPNEKSKDWWQNLDGKILKIWDDEYSSQTHQFTCRFGDIKSIVPNNEGRLQCEFKDGNRITLKGGSNDIGTTVIINDFELGIVKLHWDKIRIVEFENSPETIEDKLGEPLFGFVKTNDEQLEGFIQWDKDERLDTDLLQGSTQTEKLEIAFQKINCIENLGNKSKVILKGGKSLILHGTNDVNSENRGIVVSKEDVGKIEIPWSSCNSVCFVDSHNNSGAPYQAYSKPERLHGNVTDLKGNEYDGLIIFDKDEKWDFEQLEGLHNEFKYIIPFRNIKTLIPKNSDYTYVILKNNNKLVLGNLQDVSSSNEGVVVIFSNGNSKFINWNEVDEINFD